MSIKLKIIRLQLESLRSILHFLLNYKKPTNNLVIFCSQQLDKFIVKYHNLHFEKTQTLQYISTDKEQNSQIYTNANQAISGTLD